ncbi:single-stranded DNA-binding protein [Sphaerotilus mobilis]|uniref:Single stranded DNA-binding protein n=1 Tax=Sphaerotilus mobilis TaxID=47994 RepID=A0A4Q7LV76_9BURK|nr:single-stranded DNA-binding protein [Sphaerotilus mobilis]RZS57808.1 single stranded DNA-binding protein [Sphaerotilus mobilis]
MAHVHVTQRHAHLAGAVKLDTVNGREGPIARAVLTAISNNRRGSGDNRNEEATAIQWTLWGAQAENAARYLGKGSHVNIIGRVRNHRYEKDGETVHTLTFTADEIDYLDSRAESEARREREGQSEPHEDADTRTDARMDARTPATAASAHQTRAPRGAHKPRADRQPAQSAA